MMRKNYLKWLGGLTLGALALTALVACGQAEAQPSKETTSDQKQTVVVATDSVTAPFTYKDGDAFAGYDIDVVNAIFEGSDKYEVKFETVKFSSILTGLDAGRYQIAANDFNYNEERAEKYIFSAPISKSNYAIGTRKGETYTTFEDLSGKSTNVFAGSNYALALENWNKANPDKTPITVNYIADTGTVAQRMQDVESGKIDFVFYDAVSLNYTAQDQGIDLDIHALESKAGGDKDGLEYLLFAKTDEGQALADFVDERIAELITDGSLAKFSEKHLGGDFVSNID